MTIINIIGCIASILGAIIAIYEALKARRYSKEVERYKNDVIERQKTIEIAQVYGESLKAIAQCRQIATPIDRRNVRGVEYQKIIDYLRNFIDFLNERIHYFEQVDQNQLHEFASNLQKDLSKFAIVESNEDRFKIGDSIHQQMGFIVSKLKEHLDIRK